MMYFVLKCGINFAGERGPVPIDYRIAYESLSKALWRYDEAVGKAHTDLMKEVNRIEQNLGKTFPPIKLAPTGEKDD